MSRFAPHVHRWHRDLLVAGTQVRDSGIARYELIPAVMAPGSIGARSTAPQLGHTQLGACPIAVEARSESVFGRLEECYREDDLRKALY